MITKKKLNTISQTFEVWQTIRAKYISAIILVRRGDYYFSFGEDAVLVNQIAFIELISNQNNQQCRISFPQLDSVLSRLVKAGNKVAVCDQLEKA